MVGISARQWGVPGGRMLTDAVTRSAAGRVTTATVSDSTKPSAPDAWTYTYGPAGRLTQAVLAAAGVRPSVSLGYLYAPTGGCGADPAAGKNGSRTGTTIQLGSGPVTSSSYCTDGASRLTAVTSTTGGLVIAAASIGYDTHGNATQLGTQTWTYAGGCDSLICPRLEVLYRSDLAHSRADRPPGGSPLPGRFAWKVLPAESKILIRHYKPLRKCFFDD